jgi:hypothetical protein
VLQQRPWSRERASSKQSLPPQRFLDFFECTTTTMKLLCVRYKGSRRSTLYTRYLLSLCYNRTSSGEKTVWPLWRREVGGSRIFDTQSRMSNTQQPFAVSVVGNDDRLNQIRDQVLTLVESTIHSCSEIVTALNTRPPVVTPLPQQQQPSASALPVPPSSTSPCCFLSQTTALSKNLLVPKQHIH